MLQISYQQRYGKPYSKTVTVYNAQAKQWLTEASLGCDLKITSYNAKSITYEVSSPFACNVKACLNEFYMMVKK